jgi:hypothetical protein
MALQTAIRDRATELSGAEIAGAYAATVLVDALALAALLRLVTLGGSRPALIAAGLPAAAMMVGALLLCHALAVAKLAQRPERPRVLR